MGKQKKLRNDDGIVYSTDPAYLSGDEMQEAETVPPSEQKLKVATDSKHRAGKLVTLVTGFIGSNDDLETLGKKLRNYCGTGGSVKNGEIVLQGDHREKVKQLLKKDGYQIRQ